MRRRRPRPPGLAEGLGVLTRRFGPPTVEAVGSSTGIAAPDSLHVRFPLRSA